jgi:hypothetical protein
VRGLVALVEEQHIEFAVVSVQDYVMSGPMSHKNELVAVFTREFGAPAVLMSEDNHGMLEFFGRLDLTQWLENNILDPSELPWREFNLAAYAGAPTLARAG